MWICLAFMATFFADVTSILEKIGIEGIDSNLAIALRTVVVVIFAWVIVFAVGSKMTILGISPKIFLFLLCSELTTGFSWICYFKALQLGDVDKVVPIDKSSTILTMILAFIF